MNAAPDVRSLPRILIVEDDADLCLLLEFSLEDLGQVVSAGSIAAARAAARATPPDLLILDVVLPDGNGLELVTELQRAQELHLPVMVLTGLGSEHDKLRGFNAGADDYLSKPFDVDELRVRVRALMRLRLGEQQLAARNHDLEQANQVASILLKTSQALTALGDQETVLKGALRLLPELFGADRTAIWLNGHGDGTAQGWGVEITRGGVPRRHAVGKQPAFGALPDLGENGILLVADAAANRPATALPREVRGGAFVAGAIERGTERLGTLFIGYDARRPFQPRMVEVVRGLCNQLAIAIENARLYEQLHEAALTDSTTGLHNMRFFRSALESELVRAKRQKEQVSVLMMDLNTFKHYNDVYGHPAGDEALRQFGRLVRGALRRYDVLARYGGDEFIVLLPATGADGARLLAERLREAVRATPVILREDACVQFTCSIGVATFPEDGVHPDELVRAADDALYESKRNDGTLRTAS